MPPKRKAEEGLAGPSRKKIVASGGKHSLTVYHGFIQANDKSGQSKSTGAPDRESQRGVQGLCGASGSRGEKAKENNTSS